jgi:hypothetical protein
MVVLQEVMKGVITHLANCSSMYDRDAEGNVKSKKRRKTVCHLFAHHVVVSVFFVFDKIEKSSFCDQKITVNIIPEKHPRKTLLL